MGNGRAGVNWPIDHSNTKKNLSVIVILPLFLGGGVHSRFQPPPPISWRNVLIVQATSILATYLLYSHSTTLDGGPRPHGFTTKICRCLKCWFWILQTLVNRLSCLKNIVHPIPDWVFGLFCFWLCFYVARSPVKTAMSTFVIKGTSNCSKERSLILQITCSERRGIWIVK